MGRVWATVIAIDQLFNAIINASPDETFSAACWRKSQNGKRRWRFARRFVDAMFWFDKDHCYNSWKNELNRGHFPDSYRKRL